MIEVELPDGAVVEFPDGTTEDTMNAALADFSAQPTAPVAAPVQEPPSYGEGRLAGVRGGFNALVASGADVLATPGRVMTEFMGLDPDKAKIDFAGFHLTDIAEYQRGAV